MAVLSPKESTVLKFIFEPGILPTLHLTKLVHFFTDSLSTSYNLKITRNSMNIIKKNWSVYSE